MISKQLHKRVMRAMRRAEKARQLWRNDISIYGPDPQVLQVIQFNASIEERRIDLVKCIEAQRQLIEEAERHRQFSIQSTTIHP